MKETTKFAAYCRNLTEMLNEEREHADALAAALRDVIAALDYPDHGAPSPVARTVAAGLEALDDHARRLALFACREHEGGSMFGHLIEKPVLVRSHLGGTYLGLLLAAYEDGTLRLRARRLWSWTGALDSTVLAVEGPAGGKIGAECEILLRPAAQVIEVIAATDVAMAAVALVPTWSR